MFSGLLDLPWWGYVLFTLVTTHITIASVTIFLHRHQAHRSLDLHVIPSHFFRFWLWMTTGMVTKEWTAIHRKHHAKCDTEEDPHSPQTRGIRKVLWQGVELYREEAKNEETLRKYGYGTPDDWLERKVYQHSVLGISLLLLMYVVLFGAIGLTMWAIQMVWIPFWAAGVINGLGHFWGYRNFNSEDASTNLIPWGIIIGGEELHNNHHTFATSAKMSARWFEFDIGWMYIRILSILGLATVKKAIPVPRLGSVRSVVDVDMLRAVITNRYDVMTHYVRLLKKVYGDELIRLKAVHSTCGSKFDIKRLRQSLYADVTSLSEAARTQLQEALAQSPRLALIHQMREELTILWVRSTTSSEQLLAQLQDWCLRAEASGIGPLREMSLRMRRYA